MANVGDSRGVLCDKDGNAIPLSHDHKPYQLKERKRIKRAGELQRLCSGLRVHLYFLSSVNNAAFSPVRHREYQSEESAENPFHY